MLRTPVLAQLLLQRLLTVGPMTEPAAVLLLESRAPGRGLEAIGWARSMGLLTRTPGTDDQPAMLEAVGAPRSLAA